jgi:outer membrane lipoprotein-sorting protein
MKPSVRFGIIALLVCSAALAQTRPDAAGILKNLSATYRAATQYEIVMDRVEKDPATGESAGAHILIAVKSPDRYRIERTGINEGGGASIVNTVVLDGSAIWLYDSQANQYVSYSAALIGKELPPELGTSGVDDSTMTRFRMAQDNAGTAKILREEDVEIGGTRMSCVVVSVTDGPDQYTWWIDKKSGHVVRESDANSMTIFTEVKLGETLPAALFKFDPPAGSSQSQR